MTAKAQVRCSGWFAGVVVLGALLGTAGGSLRGGEPAPEAENLTKKFEQCLREAEEKAWEDIAVPIFSGPFAAFTWWLFPNDCGVVYTISDPETRRVSALNFYDLATAKTSKVDLFTEDKEKLLTLSEWRISPDSKRIWLYLERTDFEGWGRWLEYDIEKKTFDRQSEAYRWLWHKHAKPRRVQMPGPVWSWPDMRLFRSGVEASNAGVKKFWQNLSRRLRKAELLYQGTLFEFITGMHQKGHVFVGGQYVTSVTVACPWLVQDCWFVRNGEEVILYKFPGHGKRGYWKSHLGERTILRVEDVPDTGVLVSSWDETSEFLDLIPFRMPEKGRQDVRARDSGSPGEGRTTETKAE